MLFTAVNLIPVHAAQVLTAETQLETGQTLTTRSGLFTLVVQTDGNVVSYFTPPLYPSRPSGFSTGTSNGHHLRMQIDGNLALYTASNTWAWTSNTGGKPYNMGFKLVLREDGGVYIYDANNYVVKMLLRDDTGSGSSARFPFRKFVSGTCVDGLTAPATSGVQANSWAQLNGGAVGYCGSFY